MATQLVAQSQQQQAKARNSLLAVGLFESVQYLARQGLPFRGHEDDEGNFSQLLKHDVLNPKQRVAYLAAAV